MTSTDDRPLDDRAPAGDGPTAEGDLSDATLARLLRWVLIGLGVAAVVGVGVGVAVTVLDREDPPPPMSATDVGFLQDMLDHHDQAVLISEIYLEERPDAGVAPYAREVILYQDREIAWMEAWLAEEGYERGAPDREAMTWMGMGMPVAEMDGMQSAEALQRLDDATGEDADLLFFAMMTDHHQGGIAMAEHEVMAGTDPEITDFAESVARNQRIEIAEYVAAAERLELIPER